MTTKHKRGSERRYRTKQVSVRLAPDELATLADAAEKWCASVPSLMRWLSLASSVAITDDVITAGYEAIRHNWHTTEEVTRAFVEAVLCAAAPAIIKQGTDGRDGIPAARMA